MSESTSSFWLPMGSSQVADIIRSPGVRGVVIPDEARPDACSVLVIDFDGFERTLAGLPEY